MSYGNSKKQDEGFVKSQVFHIRTMKQAIIGVDLVYVKYLETALTLGHMHHPNHLFRHIGEVRAFSSRKMEK